MYEEYYKVEVDKTKEVSLGDHLEEMKKHTHYKILEVIRFENLQLQSLVFDFYNEGHTERHVFVKNVPSKPDHTCRSPASVMACQEDTIIPFTK